MRLKLKEKLERAFRLTHDLAAHLDESTLSLDLPGLPSNQISGQFWCIIGARESYIQGIKIGSWQGFSCSLKTPLIKSSVLTALEESLQQLVAIDFSALSENQIELAFALLEHEVQHHGQLIRFVYANRLTFPPSWNQRYTV